MTIHASCVAFGEFGVLLLGDSDAGKSHLAARLIDEQGAALVSDDRTIIAAKNNKLTAAAPNEIAGLLEQRGLGLVRRPYLETANLCLAIELVMREQVPRLPPPRFWAYQQTQLPLLALCPFEATTPALIKLAAMYFTNNKQFPKDGIFTL